MKEGKIWNRGSGIIEKLDLNKILENLMIKIFWGVFYAWGEAIR